MPVRTSTASWSGNLKDGKGTMAFGSGAFEGAYTYASRFQEGEGTNPEELIGAAHAGCYAMALANELASDGYDPQQVDASAAIHLEGGEITKSVLTVEATVPDIDAATFQEYADGAKTDCPVSQALGAIDIELEASLR